MIPADPYRGTVFWGGRIVERQARPHLFRAVAPNSSRVIWRSRRRFDFSAAARRVRPMGVLEAARWIGEVMRAIPGPTDEWARVIGSLAWPGVALYLVTRYRGFLRHFLETIATRLRTDHVKIGMFEMTPNSDLIALDPAFVNQSTEHYEPADIERIERLWEFISEPDGYDKLVTWMNEELDETLDMVEFLTEPRYATQRESAHRALVEDGKI